MALETIVTMKFYGLLVDGYNTQPGISNENLETCLSNLTHLPDKIC